MGEDGGGVFRNGQVVEISTDEEGFRGAWYIGRVIKVASKRNKKVLVQYNSLMADEEGREPLTELVDEVQLRPLPPRETSRRFHFSEEVDAFHNDGWWEGVVTEVNDDRTYSVFFRCSREQILFREPDLRLHREWVSQKWVPPMPPTVEMDDEKVFEVDEGNDYNAYFKWTIEMDCTMLEVLKKQKNKCQKEGRIFSAEIYMKVVEEINVKFSLNIDKNKVLNRLKTLKKQMVLAKKFELKSGIKWNDSSKIFEAPPEVWESLIKVNPKFKNIQGKSFHHFDILKEIYVKDITIRSQAENMNKKEGYREGERVEISTDEDGFEGAWFGAKVIQMVGDGRYLIEYDSLRSEDGDAFLKEEVSRFNMRPHVPVTTVDKFGEFEEVDALYNDGWWVGIISTVLQGSKYMVYFRDTEEELQFDHSKLRQHQEWINGEWISASKALHLDLEAGK